MRKGEAGTWWATYTYLFNDQAQDIYRQLEQGQRLGALGDVIPVWIFAPQVFRDDGVVVIQLGSRDGVVVVDLRDVPTIPALVAMLVQVFEGYLQVWWLLVFWVRIRGRGWFVVYSAGFEIERLGIVMGLRVVGVVIAVGIMEGVGMVVVLVMLWVVEGIIVFVDIVIVVLFTEVMIMLHGDPRSSSDG